MPKKKKPFIDKKKSVTFQLVHRSLKDPLAADADAPQRVLLPYGGEQRIPDSVSECENYTTQESISERKKYGIDYEDDYDYMQHLRQSTENQPAILVPKSKHAFIEVEESNDGMSEIYRNNEPVLKLPSVVFGSTVEEPVGMLFRAIPPVGPQPSWDPDIVAGIDDDFDFENPENQLEDGFVALASQPGDDDMGESEFGSDASYEDDSDYQDTKSQFTHYSLTSSVIRRNKQLTLLDDKFERFFQSYDDSKIGELAPCKIEGDFPVDDLSKENDMTILLGLDKRKRNEFVEEKATEWNKRYALDVGEASDDEPMMTLVQEETDRRWDCETILSTYSTLYNHPKIIEEQPSKIKLRESTRLPDVDVAKLTKHHLRIHNLDERFPLRETVCSHRNKDETKEEKSLRKKAVKEAKKERRMEKKATRKAFKEEKSRQNKEIFNLKQNLNGLKIS